MPVLFGDKIRALRISRKMSQQEFADLLGTSKQVISRYETSQRIPKISVVQHIANVLGVSISYLAEDASFEKDNPKKKTIPVYGKVAAGIPIEAIEDIEDYEEIDIDEYGPGDYMALKIHGPSMEPRMMEGDVVIIRCQPTVDNGEIAIVIVNGNDATCKKIKRTSEGITLISINPAFDPKFYSNKEIETLPVRILGKVVELRAKY